MHNNKANAEGAQLFVTRGYGNNPSLLEQSFAKVLNLYKSTDGPALFVTGNEANIKNSVLFLEFFGEIVITNLIREGTAQFRGVDILLATRKSFQATSPSLVYAPHVELEFLKALSNLPFLKALVFVPWSEGELHELASIFPKLNWI